jgi:hypothetical protein
LEGRFGGASKMEGDLEALLEMDFCTKPPNFGLEANMEAPTGDALRAFICFHEKTAGRTLGLAFGFGFAKLILPSLLTWAELGMFFFS